MKQIKNFNTDLIAPAFEYAVAIKNEDGSLNKDWIQGIIHGAEADSGLKKPKELMEMRKRIFDWLMVPEAERWFN